MVKTALEKFNEWKRQQEHGEVTLKDGVQPATTTPTTRVKRSTKR